MSSGTRQHRGELRAIARRVMIERGLEPDFSPAVLAETGAITRPADDRDPAIHDLRYLLWASIDNDDSRDLDQLSVAEPAGGDAMKILVAVADVDAVVRKGSAIDGHARANTTSVYTAADVFPMLPEKLSTDLTSLGEGDERLALVVEMTIGADGAVASGNVYRGRVVNHAKLAYNAVAAWLDATGPAPPRIAAVPGLDAQLRLQDRVAQAMRAQRHRRGALSLETLEPRPVFDGDVLADLLPDEKNRAKELIEDYMIAANEVTAKFLDARGSPSLRRVLRAPERWERIVELAAGLGERLHSRDRPQPAIPRPHPPAPPQGGARRTVGAVHRRGARCAGPPLHRAGGQRRQGGAPGAEVRGGAPPRVTDRRAVRRDRDRRVRQGHVGARAPAAGGREGRPRVRGDRRRRPGARGAGAHGRRARLHRFRARLVSGRSPRISRRSSPADQTVSAGTRSTRVRRTLSPSAPAPSRCAITTRVRWSAVTRTRSAAPGRTYHA